MAAFLVRGTDRIFVVVVALRWRISTTTPEGQEIVVVVIGTIETVAQRGADWQYCKTLNGVGRSSNGRTNDVTGQLGR